MSCCNCKTAIHEDTKALQCDRCMRADAWKCIDCLNINHDMYDLLIAGSNIPLHWFCDSCEHVVMDSRSCISPYQNDKLDNLISLVEKLMQKYESFESKLDGKCDIADAAKLESRITRLEDKFTQWDLQAETRLVIRTESTDYCSGLHHREDEWTHR